MSPHVLRPRSRGRRTGATGFTLLAVLIAVAVMAGLVATYGRHVVVVGRSGMSSPQLLAAREAAHSGLAFARQAAVSGEALASGSIPVGDGEVALSVETTAGGNQRVSAESLAGDGLGARRVAEIGLQPTAATFPAGPASLPTLNEATLDALLADESLVWHAITTSQRIGGVELSGVLVIHPGVELLLDDVVLTGAVLSASVLDGDAPGDFDAGSAPRLVVDGNLRIDAGSGLPGLAILMPDGAVESGDADARIQIHGDVVAHDLSLLHAGVIDGHVLGVDVSLADAAMLDRMGADRKSPEWSSALQLGGAAEPVFLAMVPASLSLASLSPIINYWHPDGTP